MRVAAWPEALRELWREQHPDAHEQTALDFTARPLMLKPQLTSFSLKRSGLSPVAARLGHDAWVILIQFETPAQMRGLPLRVSVPPPSEPPSEHNTGDHTSSRFEYFGP